jgi:hypothetical protein
VDQDPSERGDRESLVLEVFEEYLEAFRSLQFVLERCLLKGWPDKNEALRATIRAQLGFCDQEWLRLKWIQHHSSFGDWTRLSHIRTRLITNWTDAEQQALLESDPRYAASENEIASIRARHNPDDVGGAYQMAARDPEFRAAMEDFKRTIRSLESRLARRKSTEVGQEAPPDLAATRAQSVDADERWWRQIFAWIRR